MEIILFILHNCCEASVDVKNLTYVKGVVGGMSMNNYNTKMPRREQLIACWRSQEAFPAEGLLSWVTKEEQEFSRWVSTDSWCGPAGSFCGRNPLDSPNSRL